MKVYVITDSYGFYGQHIYPWVSIDVKKIIKTLRKNFEVVHVTFFDVANGRVDIEGASVIYTSSQQTEYKEYIEDVLIYLMQKNNLLIPSINMFKSHENKGYQELYKRMIGIESIEALYVGNHKELPADSIKYPCVVKKLSGYGSGGVRLVQSKENVVDFTTTDECVIRRGFARRIVSMIAKPIRKYLFGKNYLNYGDYYDYFERFILQRFIPEMSYDYKILIFSDKFYVLKRYAQKGDFRASGSGKFLYDEVSDELLEFAERVFIKFDVPFISLDICFDGMNYHLIEFQGMHFGPYTLINSNGYYSRNGDRWDFNECRSDFDEEVAKSLLDHIAKYKCN